MKKIVQTAGRNALNEFAPQFAHFNDDVLFGENWKGLIVWGYYMDSATVKNWKKQAQYTLPGRRKTLPGSS